MGGYIARILNSFAYLPDNCKGVRFDGYLQQEVAIVRQNATQNETLR